MKLLFLTLLFLFVSLWAKPPVAFEEEGLKTSFFSLDETGKDGVVQNGVATISVALKENRFKRLISSNFSQTFFLQEPNRTTGLHATAFCRDADKVGLPI